MMQSLYSAAISGAKTILNHQIDELQEQKDAAIEALEEEKEAACKVIQDQIDALEEQKEAIEKANEARQRAIDLQKAQYELERAQSQRTRLTYKDGQMVYQHDNQAVTDAKEDVRQKLLDIEIAAIDEQIDALNKKLEETEEYYDELIKKTEKYYDDQIKALQKQLKAWEEIEEEMEMAEAIAALKELGYTMEDVLSGNPAMLEDIRTGYGALNAALKGDFDSYAEAMGMSAEALQGKIREITGYTDDVQNWADEMKNMFAQGSIDTAGLDNLKDKVGEVDKAISSGSAGNVESTETTDTSAGTGGIAKSATAAKTALEGLGKANLGELPENIKTIGDSIKDAAENIEGLSAGLEGLAQVGTGLTTLAGDANTLSSSLENVASILGVSSGGEEEQPSAPGDVFKGKTPSRQSEDGDKSSKEGGDGTLVGAFHELEEIDLSNTIAQIGGEDGESETLTGVLTAANAQISGASNGGAEDTTGMLGSLTAFDEEANNSVPGITQYFTELNAQLEACQGNLWSMLEAIKQMASAFANMSFGGNLGTNGGIFTGTAYANGNWSAGSKGINGKALVGELGQELIVHPNGRFETVGDNGAEFKHVGANDIVFNHRQTEDLLKNGKINSRGKAYAGGKLPEGFSSLSNEDSMKYNLLGEVENLVEKLEFGNQKLITLDKNVSAIASHTTTNNYSSTPIINVTNPTFTCTGVTGEAVLHEIENSFKGLFVNAYQQSMTK